MKTLPFLLPRSRSALHHQAAAPPPPQVAVTTGEEDEDPILDLKAKLYRFDKDGNQWKERGAGSVKFLKHKVTGKVRLVMRQSKTLKICANHLVLPTMIVQEN
ncbi:Ran-binding protein 1 b [Dionaea muscipula]